ncbi:NUDIX domain-containing protein [Cohnella cholangitidis]|nr:NUDIX domain-containing protein [Cohnella cholangitidis]
MYQWHELSEIDHELVKFVVLIAQYNNQFIIVKNSKRGGWEIPGGNREPGEPLFTAASRELYEETGAIQSDLEPFGIYMWNGNYGMVFFAEIHLMAELPAYEIEEVKEVDQLPEGLNFGEMFYFVHRKWTEYEHKNTQTRRMDIRK